MSNPVTSALIGAYAEEQLDIPVSNLINVQPPTVIGDGLAGPRNRQQLMIYRDTRPIAADELAFQASLGMQVIARHSAGRYFFLSPEYTPAGSGLRSRLPGLPLQPGLPGPRQLATPGMQPATHGRVRGPRVLPPARTVVFTATPYVGYDW